MQHCWKQWKILIVAVVTVALPAWLLKHLHLAQNQNLLVKASYDLVRDLNLSKESPEIFESRLGEHGTLDSGTKITFYLNGDDLLNRFFTMEDEFVYCNKLISSQVFLQKWVFHVTIR